MLEGNFEIREIENCSSETINKMILTLPVLPEVSEISLVYEPFLELNADKKNRRRYLGFCRKFEIGADSLITLNYDERLKTFSQRREFKKNNFLYSCGKVCRIEAKVERGSYNIFRNNFFGKAFSGGYVVEHCILHFNDNLLAIGLYKKPQGVRFFLNQNESKEKDALLKWLENFNFKCDIT